MHESTQSLISLSLQNTQYVSRSSAHLVLTFFQPTDIGRFKAAFRSEELEQQEARIRELEAEMKKFKEVPLLNDTARDVLEDLKGVVPPEGLKNIEERLKTLETAEPLQFLKSVNLLAPGDPTLNGKIVEVFMKHYEKLYNTLKAQSGKNQWPTEFYDRSKRQQEGIEKYKAASTAALNSVCVCMFLPTIAVPVPSFCEFPLIFLYSSNPSSVEPPTSFLKDLKTYKKS